MKDNQEEEIILQSLSTIFDDDFVDISVETKDDIDSALSEIGRNLGITFIFPEREHSGLSSVHDIIANACSASGVRWRRVYLASNWYKYDAGHLLVFSSAGHAGAAIRNGNSYNVTFSDNEPVVAPHNLLLKETAYCFYSGFDRDVSSFRKLVYSSFRYIKSDFKDLIKYNLFLGLLGLLVPYSFGLLTEQVIPESNYSSLFVLAAGLLAAAISIGAIYYLKIYSLHKLETRLSNFLQPAVWDRLLRKQVSFYKKFSSGDLAQRALGIMRLKQTISGATITSLSNVVFMVFYFLLLLYYVPLLALMSFIPMILVAALNVALMKRQLFHQSRYFDINGEVSTTLIQQLNAISKIKLTGISGRALSIWSAQYRNEKREELNVAKYSALLHIINLSAPVISTLFLFVFPFIVDLNLSVATFVSFQATYALFLYTGMSVSSAVMSIWSVRPLYIRLQPILMEDKLDKKERKQFPVKGAIDLQHVSFRYEKGGPLVLNDVSLKAAPGDFIAVTGASGSGKSTIMKLILGFYTPEAGSVYIDNHDISKIDLEHTRNHFGVVLQSDGVFAGSILENIKGARNYSMQEVEDAILLADLKDEIDRLPMGLHTIIPQGGGSFSGGQIQRILLTRAIISKPKILFLDEATSALDNISQEKITKSLMSLDMTKVVIAHRKTTIQDADKVYHLEHGKLLQMK